jgi:probable HAF family extracellular repeat protein
MGHAIVKKRNSRAVVVGVEQVEARLLLSAAPQFTVKDLGLAQNVHDINSSGQVVAEDWLNRAAVSVNGGPLSPITNNYGTFGSGINDSGQVAGYTNTQGAYRFTPGSPTVDSPAGSITYLGSFDGSPHPYAYGQGINNHGNVTGWSYYQSGSSPHAFFYDGTMHDIGTLYAAGGPNNIDSAAFAINDSNQIVGSSWNGHAEHAFFYDGIMHDLGSLNPGGAHDWSEAHDVNSLGQVVGFSGGADVNQHAFISDQNGGAIHDIGLIPGATGDAAFSINDKGHVVGYSWMASGQPSHGFYYDGSSIVDLNSLVSSNSGFTIEYGRGINSNDQIAALGVDASGYEHALLLTPVPPTPVAPTITWANPTDIVYGMPLSATQLDATASVPGTFTYMPAAGTVLHAGAAQTLSATSPRPTPSITPRSRQRPRSTSRRLR